MRARLWLALAGAVVACSTPGEVCGCPPALGIGIVAGVVTRADGAPAAQVPVRVDVRLRGCTTEPHVGVVDPNVTGTDDAGRYRYLIRAYAPSDTSCVRIVATDPASGDSAAVDGIRMRLISSYLTRERPESLRVDLRLP